MACGQGGSLDVEPAGESRRDCRGTCQATCAQNSTRSAEPALSRGYERALKLVNPGHRPLAAVCRSSLRLFGPRTHTDGPPIWGIRVKLSHFGPDTVGEWVIRKLESCVGAV